MTKGLTDLEAKRKFSQMMYEATKQSWDNRKGRAGKVIVDHDSFSGNRHYTIDGNDLIHRDCTDGVGTKFFFAEWIQDWRTIAHNLFAMTADDGGALGYEPIMANTCLGVNVIKAAHAHFHEQLVEGYVKAAKLARVAVFSGETAELGERVAGYGGFNIDWVATVHCAQNDGKQLTGKKVEVGDSIVAFQEKGFRSNGYTKVREILDNVKGRTWYKGSKGEELCRELLRPSIIYTPAFVDLIGGVGYRPKADVHAIAHVTGGGLEKVARALAPSGFGAAITKPFDPPHVMADIQTMGKVDTRGAYCRWNMGNGAYVIVNPKDESTVIDVASKYSIKARFAGRVIREPALIVRTYEGKLESWDLKDGNLV